MGTSKLDTLEGRPDFIKKFVKSYGKTNDDILAADATETAASAKVAHQGWTIPAGGNGNPNAMRETVIAMNIGSDIGTDDDAGLGIGGGGGGAGAPEHSGEFFRFNPNMMGVPKWDLGVFESDAGPYNSDYFTWIQSVVNEGTFLGDLSWSAERTITVYIPKGNFSSIQGSNINQSLNTDTYIVLDIKGALLHTGSVSASYNYTQPGFILAERNAADPNGDDNAFISLFTNQPFSGMSGGNPFYCQIYSGVFTSGKTALIS